MIESLTVCIIKLKSIRYVHVKYTLNEFYFIISTFSGGNNVVVVLLATVVRSSMQRPRRWQWCAHRYCWHRSPVNSAGHRHRQRSAPPPAPSSTPATTRSHSPGPHCNGQDVLPLAASDTDITHSRFFCTFLILFY